MIREKRVSFGLRNKSAQRQSKIYIPVMTGAVITTVSFKRSKPVT